jgi:hypothetical protein
MSLPRQDCRVKLDADMHQALVMLAEIDDLLPAKWAERAICRAIRERIHAASLVSEKASRLGIAGISREEPSGFGSLE